MARTRQLVDLRADVRWQCDQERATLRHTDPALTRQINQSIQRFRLKISRDAKLPYYLSLHQDTLSAGAEGVDEPYTAWTHGIASLVWIRSVAVTHSGEVRQLEEVPFDSLYHYQEGSQGATGYPTAWTAPNTLQILILPASNGDYHIQVWYLPAATDLSADANTFDGIAGWEDWIVFDVCSRVLLRDDHPEQVAVFEQYKAQVWDDIMRSKEMGRAGPHKRLDVRGRRNGERSVRRWPS